MPDAFRCATPMEDWRTFKFTVTESGGMLGIKAAIKAGVSYLYRVNDAVGMLIESALVDEEAVFAYHVEKVMVPKKIGSAESFLPGDRVYWDPADRLVTPVWNSGFLWIGMATEPATITDERVEIDLFGSHAQAEADI